MKAKVLTWITNVENGNIKTKTEAVLSMVRNFSETYQSDLYGITIHEIRETYSIPHQSLTACLSMLHDEGVIKIVGVYEHDNKYYSKYRYVFDNNERYFVSAKRKLEKYNEWLKRGIEEFEQLMPSSLLMELMLNLNDKSNECK